MRNRQPFYHRVDGLTIDGKATQLAILGKIAKALRRARVGFLGYSLELETFEASDQQVKLDGLLFTATEWVEEGEFVDALRTEFDNFNIEPEGYSEPEAGDPTDLM